MREVRTRLQRSNFEELSLAPRRRSQPTRGLRMIGNAELGRSAICRLAMRKFSLDGAKVSTMTNLFVPSRSLALFATARNSVPISGDPYDRCEESNPQVALARDPDFIFPLLKTLSIRTVVSSGTRPPPWTSSIVRTRRSRLGLFSSGFVGFIAFGCIGDTIVATAPIAGTSERHVHIKAPLRQSVFITWRVAASGGAPRSLGNGTHLLYHFDECIFQCHDRPSKARDLAGGTRTTSLRPLPMPSRENLALSAEIEQEPRLLHDRDGRKTPIGPLLDLP